MQELPGISEVKARLAAMCDRASRGEVIQFSRRRGNRIERFELRRVTETKRQLGGWEGRLTEDELESLTAPLSEAELRDWNI